MEIAVVVAAVLLIQLGTALTQQRIGVNEGRGWDGTVYHAVAEQLRDGDRPSGGSRFARRLGTPYLAGLVSPNDLIKGFTIVNAVAGFGSALLLLLWLRAYLANPWVRVALVLVHATHWLQLSRFTFFYPVQVDGCAQLCCLAGLHCVTWYERKPARWPLLGVTLVSVAGVLFRELVLVIPVAFLFATNPKIRHRLRFPYISTTNPPHFTQLIPLVLACATLAAVASFVISSDPEFSAVNHLENRALSRNLANYLMGWLIAFGPVLFVVLFDWREAIAFLEKHKAILVYLIGVAVVAWAGSLDSERHALYWAAPVIYVLTGRAIERHPRVFKSWSLVAALLAAQVLVNRPFVETPQPEASALERLPTIILTPLGADARYADLFPNDARPHQVWIQWWQFLALGGLLLFWMSRRAYTQCERTQRAGSDAPVGSRAGPAGAAPRATISDLN